MFTPPLAMRRIICSGVRRLATVVRSGPQRPPYELIKWQLRQPFAWNTTAPSKTGPLVTPTTLGGSGCALKFGDQLECTPATQSEPTIVTIITTLATAQGRPRGLRTPRLNRNGGGIIRIPAS